MIIRDKQIAELERSMLARYYEQLRDFFRQNFPELVSRLDNSSLLARISDGDRKANDCGIRTDQGRIAYIGLSFAAGPNFMTDPVIREFLGSPGNDPDAKIEWLFKRVAEKLQLLPSDAGSNQPTQEEQSK